jgi:hypothetical protein
MSEVRTSPRPVRGRRLLAAVAGVPDRLVVMLFWTSVVVSVTVLVGQFTPVVVLPLLVAVLAATWRLVPAPVLPTRSAALGALSALGLVALWVALNVPYVARYVVVTRDPGFLTLEGFWLTEHASPDIPMGSAEAVADSVRGFTAETGAYFPSDGALHAQGAKLLPGLLGLGGWAGGDAGVLVTNLLVSGIALLAVYGLARRVVGSWWALLPVVALGASIPMLVFSRAAYTEPLNVALVFGALTFSWTAFETRSWWRHLLSGALVGATALARIDGAASVIGFIAGLAVAAGAALLPRARRRGQAAFFAAGGAALLLVALGYADLRLHSPGYLSDLGDQFEMLAGVLVATAVVGVLITVPRFWDPLRRVLVRRRRGLAAAAVVAVVLVAVLLSTRFLWLPGHDLDPASGYANVVAGLQEREGMPVEPSRSYDDWSVRWLSWYYGWPMVVLSFAGLAVLAHRAIARRDPRLLVLLAVIAAPSALYLWRVSITPDQVWAMRRLLPVTLPGFLVATAVTLHALWTARRRWLQVVAAALAAVVAVTPFTTWTPLLRVPEQDNRLGEIRAICAALPSDHVVYIQAGGPNYLATLRSICDVEVIQVERPPTADELERVREAWDVPVVSVVAFRPDDLPFAGDEVPAPFRTTEISTWSYALSYLPFEPEVRTSTVWIGTVDEDGTIVTLPPEGTPAG